MNVTVQTELDATVRAYISAVQTGDEVKWYTTNLAGKTLVNESKQSRVSYLACLSCYVRWCIR